jgi:alkylhydroperoxidase family enzyme
MRSHGAVASYAMGEEIWKAVEKDWRSAPLRPELKATLAFLEKQTIAPDELTVADADLVRAAGVSDDALRDAATVCAMFNMITRLAEAFRWDVPPWEAVLERAPKMLDDGYELEAIFGRM